MIEKIPLTSLPPGWRIFPLDAVADVHKETCGLIAVSGEDNYVSAKDIDAGNGNATPRTLSLLVNANPNYKVLKFSKNDIVYNPIQPSLNKVWLADRDGFASSSLMILRAQPPATPQFLFHLFRSSGFVDKVVSLQIGSTQAMISYQRLRRISVLLPSNNTQNRVSDILGEIDKIQVLSRQTSFLPELLIKNAFEKIFGDLDANPRNWHKISLKELINIEAGTNFRCLERSATSSEYGTIKTSAVSTGVFLPEENKALAPDVIPFSSLQIHRGDLLLNRANSPEFVGATAIVEGDFKNLFLSDKIWRLCPRAAIKPWFLKTLLSSSLFREKMRNMATGSISSMVNLRQKELLSLDITVPPLNLQIQFQNFCETVSFLAEQQRDQKKQLNLLYSSISHNIFGEKWRILKNQPTSSSSTASMNHWSFEGQLSASQHQIWAATVGFSNAFGITDLMEKLQPTHNTHLLHQSYIRRSLEILEVLGAIIKEGREDIDMWRNPDIESDSEVEL